MKKLLDRFIFNEKLDLNLRILNLVEFCGAIASIVALIARIIMQVTFWSYIIMLVMLFSIILLAIVTNKWPKLARPVTMLVLIGICDIIFPAIYYTNGGYNGGMPAYYVLSVVLIFMLAFGKARVILSVTHIIVYLLTFILDYFDILNPLPLNSTQALIDIIQSVSVSGLLIGILIVFQRKIYDNEKLLVEQKEKYLSLNNEIAFKLISSESGDFTSTLDSAISSLMNVFKVEEIKIGQVDDNDSVDRFKYRFHKSSGEYSMLLDEDTTLTNWNELYPIISSRSSLTQLIYKDSITTIESDERPFLLANNIKSLLIIPINLFNNFWGFVSYTTHNTHLSLNNEQIDILISSSLVIVNSLYRNDTTKHLAESLEKAESSARAKSDFLSNMSHEMRTPMNAIIGMTRLAQSSSEIDRKNYCLEKISDSSIHLLGVINDILDMSKIESGKFELSFQDFNFEKLIKSAVNVINFKIEEKNIEFSVSIDNNIPKDLFGDDLRISQVIVNLLSNASKFTKDGGSISLVSKLIKKDDDKVLIEIIVSDNGIGMSSEQIKKLFKSFSQADASTSRKFGGTGLGLAISKNIVELMEGSITVKSKEGEGTSFQVYIPLAISTITYENSYIPDYSSVNILVIDKQLKECTNISNILKHNKIKNSYSTNYNDTETLLLKHPKFDLYFVDVNTIVLDDFKILSLIKQYNSEAKIVLLSRETTINIDEITKVIDAKRVINKPVFESQLLSGIDNLVLNVTNNTEYESLTKNVDFSKKHILLVEDIEINREIVIELLSETNVEIDIAENGLEAFNKVKDSHGKYDLIFMDIQMPIMDGYTAAKKIRDLDGLWFKTVPIIAMTANVFKDDVDKAINSGMNDHIAKPIDFDDVIKKLIFFMGSH